EHPGRSVVLPSDLVLPGKRLLEDAILEDELDVLGRKRPLEPESPLDFFHVSLEGARVLVDRAHILVSRHENPNLALTFGGRLLDEGLKLRKAVGIVLDPLSGLVEDKQNTRGLLRFSLLSTQILEHRPHEELDVVEIALLSALESLCHLVRA